MNHIKCPYKALTLTLAVTLTCRTATVESGVPGNHGIEDMEDFQQIHRHSYECSTWNGRSGLQGRH